MEINVTRDRARGSSVPETISQYKAEYQSLLWKESEERRNAGVTLTALLLGRVRNRAPLCFPLMQIPPFSSEIDRKLSFLQ